jgi:hypothetical protein
LFDIDHHQLCSQRSERIRRLTSTSAHLSIAPLPASTTIVQSSTQSNPIHSLLPWRSGTGTIAADLSRDYSRIQTDTPHPAAAAQREGQQARWRPSTASSALRAYRTLRAGIVSARTQESCTNAPVGRVLLTKLQPEISMSAKSCTCRTWVRAQRTLKLRQSTNLCAATVVRRRKLNCSPVGIGPFMDTHMSDMYVSAVNCVFGEHHAISMARMAALTLPIAVGS